MHLDKNYLAPHYLDVFSSFDWHRPSVCASVCLESGALLERCSALGPATRLPHLLLRTGANTYAYLCELLADLQQSNFRLFKVICVCLCATAVNLVMQVVSRGLDAQKDFTRLVEATRMLPRIWLPRRCRRRRRRR